MPALCSYFVWKCRNDKLMETDVEKIWGAGAGAQWLTDNVPIFSKKVF